MWLGGVYGWGCTWLMACVAEGVYMAGGHVWREGGMHGWGHVWPGGMYGWGHAWLGSAWLGGMHGWGGGMCGWGCAWLRGMHAPQQILQLWHMVNELAVCILLECILASANFEISDS